MRVSSTQFPEQHSRASVWLWLLLVFFAAGVALPNFPGIFPRPVLAATQAIPAFLFALVHGAKTYKFRGSLAFVAISLIVGYTAEAMGVHTGFPFGHYYFTDGMGPKLYGVPVLMGPAYVGMGYVSWTVARFITAPAAGNSGIRGARLISLPLAASFVMVAWDIAIDPVLSTYAHYWIWTEGGAFYGVPISNFLGWYATNYLIYQLFALCARKQIEPVSARADRLAVFFYAICAVGITVRALAAQGTSVVVDSAGTTWKVSHINAAAILAAVFIMGAFVILALVRFSDRDFISSPPTFTPQMDFDKDEVAFARQIGDDFEETP